MVDGSADREGAAPQSSVGGGVASSEAAAVQSGAAGARAGEPVAEVGSDEEAMSAERGVG